MNIEKQNHETFDAAQILITIWEEGKTASKLARTGINIELNGRVYNVKHNRRRHGAILWLRPEDNPSKVTILQVNNAYVDINGRGFTKDNLTISANPQLGAQLTGHLIENDEIIFSVDDNTDIDGVHEAIMKSPLFADVSRSIKRYIIKWGGDINRLFPNSLLFDQYDSVRVSPEGDLIIHNYGISTHDFTSEKQEQMLGSRLQRAINIKNGIILDQDLEDISISFHEKQIRDYIKNVIKETNLSVDHPLFQELYDYYVGIYMQIRNTRESLTHLVEVQMDEHINVNIGASSKTEYRAYYSPKDSMRSKSPDAVTDDSYQHGAMTFAHDAFEQPVIDSPAAQYLEIKPCALRAEIRHHVHYLRHNLIGRPMPCGNLGTSGLREMVDEMQFFPAEYARYSKEPFLLEDIPYSLNKSKMMWDVMTLVDTERNIGIFNGHVFPRHVRFEIIKKLLQDFPKLSEKEINMIDRAVFEFLSNVKPVPGNRIYILSNRVKAYFEYGDVYDVYKAKQVERITRVTGNDNPDLNGILDLVNEYESFLADVKRFERKRCGKGGHLFMRNQLLVQLAERKNKLAALMVEHLPYRAPDGNDYPSMISYYLNPEIIYGEILRRCPQLAQKKRSRDRQ